MLHVWENALKSSKFTLILSFPALPNELEKLRKLLRKKSDKDSYQQVMLFGHNPGFTELAEYLTNQRFDNIPTCGIVCMDFDITSWKEVAEGKGDVVFFDYPKKHT
jgi:phosphohistidine phosphatase